MKSRLLKFLPKKTRTAEKTNVALRIDPVLAARVKMALHADGLTWHDLFIAACKRYLAERREKK